METQQYYDNYNEPESADYQNKERKKKRHRKPKEYNEEDLYNAEPIQYEPHIVDRNTEDDNQVPRRKQRSKPKRREDAEEYDPSINQSGYYDEKGRMNQDINGSPMSYEQPQYLNSNFKKSEDLDSNQIPKRKHRSKHKPKEYDEEDQPIDNQRGYHEERPDSPQFNFNNEGIRKPRKERKKKSPDQNEDMPDNAYLNINVRSPTGSNHNYPFKESNDSVQLEDDLQSHDEDIAQSEDISIRNDTPVEDRQKKKSGGFMKIFASFKKKNKAKKSDNNAIGKQWKSNPEIFNPAYDSQPNTLERSKKSGKIGRGFGSLKAHVILLDGMEVEFDSDQKMLGKDLFDQVCVYLDLIEKDFFGITYVNTKLKTWFWLEMDKKISKQLTSADEWIFNFQVKFYPAEPVLLQEDITRYLLSLQVRQDVFTGKLPCSWITQALLGSFMVQSELGDYDELEHGEGIEYLREFEFVLNQSDQLLEKIAELHKKHINMPPDKADIKYLETAKRLEQYGVDLHPARDNDDVEIFIGVCYQGVLIYRDRIRIGRFAWPKVLRISYKKNYFYLKIRSDRYDDSVAIVGFKLFNHYLAKRLWKNAVEQHTFFRMKEPQHMKPMPRLIPTAASTYNYTGKTLHQYRSMNISRNEPVKFDRSLTKRRTIGSMPAGLDSAGIQYSSMHSLNRSHPRDMTLGKTKSIEYLSSKRPGSNMGIGQGSTGNISNRQIQPQIKFHPYGINKEDDRHMSFQSGDSLNAADSYTARNDDQVSLPPMPSVQQPEYARPYKQKNPKIPRSNDVLSDDGLDMQVEYNKIVKRQIIKSMPATDISHNEEINSQPDYTVVIKKHSSKTTRPNEGSTEDNVIDYTEHTRSLKKQHSKTSRPVELSDEENHSQPVYAKPTKKHSSKHNRTNDNLSDENNNLQAVNSKPLKKKHSRSHQQNDDLSADNDNDIVPPSVQDRAKFNVKGGVNLITRTDSNQPQDTSQSEDLHSYSKVVKRQSNSKVTISTVTVTNQSRPNPPQQFRPPPPPPEQKISNVRSNSSSEQSSPMEHNLPPPPPPIVDSPQVASKPKPPPVKPKPQVKPKPNLVVKEQVTVTKYSSRYDDESSNDDML